MFVSSSKKTNRLLSKGMANIYFKVTIEKKLRLSKFKKFVSSFWGTPTQVNITEFSNFLLRLKNQGYGSKSMCGFFIIFILKGIMRF